MTARSFSVERRFCFSLRRATRSLLSLSTTKKSLVVSQFLAPSRFNRIGSSAPKYFLSGNSYLVNEPYELMHFLHWLPSTIRARPLTVIQLQSNMHFLHIAFPLSCCIFCTNCRRRSAKTTSPQSVRLEKVPRRNLRPMLHRIAEALQPSERGIFEDGFGEFCYGHLIVSSA